MSATIETIASTLHDLATPDMKPRTLIKAVREKHPGASKKDVIRAAFYAVITQADEDPEKADRLQAMAISERAAPDDDKAAAEEPVKPRKKRKTKA